MRNFSRKILKPVLKPLARMYFSNPFTAQVVDANGEVKWEDHGYNDIVDEGLNSLLDVYFRNQTQIAVWYMRIIDGVGTQTLSNSDTAASHAGWSENTAHTGGTGISWTDSLGAAASRSISNSTTLDFAYTTTETIHGIFIQSVASGTTGTLWATAPFSTEVTVNNGDTLKVTYTVSG